MKIDRAIPVTCSKCSAKYEITLSDLEKRYGYVDEDQKWYITKCPRCGIKRYRLLRRGNFRFKKQKR